MIRSLLKYMILFAVLLMMTGCEHYEMQEAGRASVDISVSIGETYSKAAIVGKDFNVDDTFGLFICKSTTETQNPYEPHNIGYNNIKATKVKEIENETEDEWQFEFIDAETSFSKIFIVSDESSQTDVTADVFAYAPYNTNIETPENIPFDISDQLDMMYALQNKEEFEENKKLSPREPNGHNVELTFFHTLSLLEFNFRIVDSKAPMRLNYITIREVTDGAPLYETAVMNAITGELQEKKRDDGTFYVRCQNQYISATGSSYDKVNMLLIPTDDAPVYTGDDIYTLRLTFDNSEYPLVYNIKSSDIKHEGGTGEMGFKAGYVYRFYFTIHNYLHLDGIQVDTEWKKGEDRNILM